MIKKSFRQPLLLHIHICVVALSFHEIISLHFSLIQVIEGINIANVNSLNNNNNKNGSNHMKFSRNEKIFAVLQNVCGGQGDFSRECSSGYRRFYKFCSFWLK